MGLLHFVPAPALFGALAAYVAISYDWRSGVMLMFLFGAGAGWRRWPQKQAMAGAVAYIFIGVVAAAIRARMAPDPSSLVTSAAAVLFLTFIGHAIGVALRGARDAAFAGGKAAAVQIGRSLSASIARPTPTPAPPPREAAAVGGWGSRDALTAHAQDAPRARPDVTLPKGWKPTVSQRRRGLFS